MAAICATTNEAVLEGDTGGKYDERTLLSDVASEGEDSNAIGAKPADSPEPCDDDKRDRPTVLDVAIFTFVFALGCRNAPEVWRGIEVGSTARATHFA